MDYIVDPVHIEVYVCPQKHFLMFLQEVMAPRANFFDPGSRYIPYAGTMLVPRSHQLQHKST